MLGVLHYNSGEVEILLFGKILNGTAKKEKTLWLGAGNAACIIAVEKQKTAGYLSVLR